MWTQDHTTEGMLEEETFEDENKFEAHVKKKRSRRRRRGNYQTEDSTTSGAGTLEPNATDLGAVKSDSPLQNEDENKLEAHVKKKRSRRRRRGKNPTEDSTRSGAAQDQSIIEVEGNKDGCLTEISASSNIDGINAESSTALNIDENSFVKSSNAEKRKRRRNRRKKSMGSQGGDTELKIENVDSSHLINEGNLNVESIGNGKINVKDLDCGNALSINAGEQSLVMSSSAERKKRRRRNKRKRASTSQGNGEIEMQSANDDNSNMTKLNGMNATNDASLNINNFDGMKAVNGVNSMTTNVDGMQYAVDVTEPQEKRRTKRRNRKRNKKRASVTEGDNVAQTSEMVTNKELTNVNDQPSKKRRRKRKRNNSVPVDVADAANAIKEENAEISDGTMKKIKLSPNDEVSDGNKNQLKLSPDGEDVLPSEENIGGNISSQQKKNKRNRNRRRRAKKDLKDKQQNNAELVVGSQENGDGIIQAADSGTDKNNLEENGYKVDTQMKGDIKDEFSTQSQQQDDNNQTNKRKRKRNRRRKPKQNVVMDDCYIQTPGITYTGDSPHNGAEVPHIEAIEGNSGNSQIFEEDFDSPALKKMRKDEQINTSFINGTPASAAAGLSAFYADEDCKNKIKKQWSEGKGLFLEDTGLEIIKEPFTCCYIPNFLENEECLKGVAEELQDLEFIMKSNDLYKFSQTSDLKNTLTPHIAELKNFLYGDFRNWLIDTTGIPLTDTVDMSSSRYVYTDVLLCHDDELENRRIAYMLYLVPPWEEQDGGSLDLFNTDEHKQPKDVVKSFKPKWNAFAFFEVSPVSFHQVAEVLSQEKIRLSINGWFHGPPIERPAKYIAPRPPLEAPFHVEEEELYSWINPSYLDMDIQKDIRHRFKADSEIELESFLAEDKYKELAEALKNENLSWAKTGPANKQFFEVLILDQVPDIIVDCLKFLKSEALFLIVSQLTGLKFHRLAPSDSEPEPDVQDNKESCPRVSVDVRRWSHGCYTLLRDDLENKCALDANLFINVSSQWSQQHGGFISYIAKNEDEELLTVTPQPNRFALVYRDVQTACFTKYINTSVCQLGEKDSSYNNFSCVFYE